MGCCQGLDAGEAMRDAANKRRITVDGSKHADQLEVAVRGQIVSLAKSPGIGHWRKDLTDEAVKFFLVYSCPIIYRPRHENLCT